MLFRTFEFNTMTFTLSSAPLENIALRENFTAPGAGAFTCFEGRVRDNNDGKSVVALDYEAYEPLCRAEMEKIFQEARNRCAAIDIKAAHRTGKLKVGELVVWVGVLAAHRDEAFTACRYVIDELKKRLPVWKKEYYADGSSQWSYCAAESTHVH